MKKYTLVFVALISKLIEVRQSLIQLNKQKYSGHHK